MVLAPGEGAVERDLGVVAPRRWVEQAHRRLLEGVGLDRDVFACDCERLLERGERGAHVAREAGPDVIGDAGVMWAVSPADGESDDRRGGALGALGDLHLLQGVRPERARGHLGRRRGLGAGVDDDPRRLIEAPREDPERGVVVGHEAGLSRGRDPLGEEGVEEGGGERGRVRCERGVLEDEDVGQGVGAQAGVEPRDLGHCRRRPAAVGGLHVGVRLGREEHGGGERAVEEAAPADALHCVVSCFCCWRRDAVVELERGLPEPQAIARRHDQLELQRRQTPAGTSRGGLRVMGWQYFSVGAMASTRRGMKAAFIQASERWCQISFLAGR